MKIRFILFFLFIAAAPLISKEQKHDVLPTSVMEGVVSGNVGGVCTFSRLWNDTNVDLVLPGPEPLVLQTWYQSIYPSWPDFTNPWRYNWYSRAYNFYSSSYICDPTGSYLPLKQKFGQKGGLKLTPNTGVTNCGYGEISGRTNHKNMVIGTDQNILTNSLGSGERYIFNKLSNDHYILSKWEKGSGNHLLYDLSPDPQSQIYSADKKEQISKVSVVNTSGQILSHVNFRKTLDDPKNRKICLELQASDDRIVTYHYQYFYGSGNNDKLPVLTKVVSPNAAEVNYEYDPKFKLIKRKSWGAGRFIDIQYEKMYSPYAGYDESESIEAVLVKRLLAPVGTDQTPILIYRFEYDPWKGQNYHTIQDTDVFDALGYKTSYHYREKNLESITKFQGTKDFRLYSNERFNWQQHEDVQHLICRYLEDDKKKILAARSFTYDSRGNVLSDCLFGNLKGLNPVEVRIGKDNCPERNKTEFYEIKRSYTNDGRNLIESENDGKGKITRYRYQQGTDLVASKFICDPNIRIREFYQYDSNGTLIEKIVDDGSTEDKNNPKDVTEIHIIRIKPKKTAPCLGLPEEISEYYVDLQSGDEILLNRVVNEYQREGWITSQKVYDSAGFQYELKWKYHFTGNIEEPFPLCRFFNNLNQEVW